MFGNSTDFLLNKTKKCNITLTFTRRLCNVYSHIVSFSMCFVLAPTHPNNTTFSCNLVVNYAKKESSSQCDIYVMRKTKLIFTQLYYQKNGISPKEFEVDCGGSKTSQGTQRVKTAMICRKFIFMREFFMHNKLNNILILSLSSWSSSAHTVVYYGLQMLATNANDKISV